MIKYNSVSILDIVLIKINCGVLFFLCDCFENKVYMIFVKGI